MGLNRQQLAERRHQAAELRAEGRDYRAIADILGVSVATAWNDVERMLEQRWQQVGVNLDAHRVAQLEDLQATRARTLSRMTSCDSDADFAKLAVTIVRLLDREARLLGLDQPVEVDVRTIPPEQAADALSAYLAGVTDSGS